MGKMKYKTLLDYKRRDKLIEEMQKDFSNGLWLLDLDPRTEFMTTGPFESISEAHENRDYIWHYGEQFGRYLWYVSPKTYDSIYRLLKNTNLNEEAAKPNIELEIDTLPLEVVAIRFVGTASIRLPSKRPSKK
jgi:hypothetical protein